MYIPPNQICICRAPATNISWITQNNPCANLFLFFIFFFCGPRATIYFSGPFVDSVSSMCDDLMTPSCDSFMSALATVVIQTTANVKIARCTPTMHDNSAMKRHRYTTRRLPRYGTEPLIWTDLFISVNTTRDWIANFAIAGPIFSSARGWMSQSDLCHAQQKMAISK